MELLKLENKKKPVNYTVVG